MRVAPPKCSCENGYYDNNETCLKCSRQCHECIYNANTCYSCIDLFHVSPPVCACKKYMYNFNGECKECNLRRCKECELNENNCIICQDPRVEPPNCECPVGYYQDEISQC